MVYQASNFLEFLDKEKVVQRLWARDATLFSDDPVVQRKIRDRLGWLFAVPAMRVEVERLTTLAKTVLRQRHDRALVLGMGGSSLWPEVVGKHLRGTNGLLLRVLDSTHPEAVADALAWCKLGKPLFVYATKSGGTIEPLSMYRFFRSHYPDGQDFVAITDPGSGLQALAKAEEFRDVFLNPPDIGGRFSAASLFGLVPAALAGVRLHDALTKVQEALEACRDDDVAGNPGCVLGVQMAEAYRSGRWQLRLALSKDVRGFGAWVEQLVAESTGKQGHGLLPVCGGVDGNGPELAEKLGHCLVCGITTFQHPDEPFVARSDEAGVPSASQVIPDPTDLWTEIVRWEFGTTICGLLLGINPFDEPDVTSAKLATQELLAGTRLPATPSREAEVGQIADLPRALAPELTTLNADDYLAVLAYVAPTTQNLQRLENLRVELQARTSAAVTVQVGPRYLHSTGQFYKGGLAKGVFAVVQDFSRIGSTTSDLIIPQSDFSFGRLIQAQADGDVAVLRSRQKPVVVLRIVDKLVP